MIMAPVGNTDESGITLDEVLTIANKSFNVNLTSKYICWSYKKKQPFSDKEKKTWTCKNRVPIEEIIAVDYVDREVKPSKNGDIEMVSVNASVFRLHVIKRAPKYLWKVKTVELHCSSSAQCALWVDSIRSLLEKFSNRPKSLLVFINPYGGKRKAQKVFDEKVAPVFDLAGITRHVITTERANHAKEYIQSHDLNRYDGIVCVGGDGMFAELLNGTLCLHNTRLGVNLDDETERLRQPPMRIGVVPAGSTDTVSYCTTGINDAVTSTLHIVIGDSMAIDVCSVRHGFTGKLIRFCVSMLGYGFYGDVLKDSETHRWMGPIRYDYSGLRTFLKNRSYGAVVNYLPSQSLQTDHHPGLMDGSRCYSGCNICKSASLLDLNGSMTADGVSAAGTDLYSNKAAAGDYLDYDDLSIMDSTVAGSMTDLSIMSRPPSSLSKIAPETWQTVSGKFIGINALTISCKCSTVPEGVSPACHLGDGSSDLVLVYDASRFNYLRHLIRITTKTSSQFDFGFVDVVRTKAFKVRVPSHDPNTASSQQTAASFQRLNNSENSVPSAVSTWNCDGEIIDEPNIDVRVHCQLVKIFARGIEEEHVTRFDQCTSTCISCSGIF